MKITPFNGSIFYGFKAILETYILYTKYLPDGADTGFFVAGIFCQSFCTKVLRSTVYRSTEMPTGRK
jgi:ABC-type arginine transport system permease subunit